ncbi:hypothetical protein [Wenjunlia tyrosinilytica]|uniref:Uncharacterized protein n=1 Tax=Wenjunlia tyrosinilytica TaxID=1544741 RepID=A0A917ZVG7_9ACTN|nr:hypothetical protein [Wenjunlia tyrosinilytica]GGO96242.1 hypothetical protein GCM10012280_55290 [Wenjunlia tyrosinilytica]
MAEPEFSATGVQIGKWLRPLTRAGQVLITDGRLRLLTSRGTEIDSAPVERVQAGIPWFGARCSARATVNGTRYLISIGDRASAARAGETPEQGAQRTVRSFLDALRQARRSS